MFTFTLFTTHAKSILNPKDVNEWWIVDKQILVKELRLQEAELKRLNVDNIQIRNSKSTDNKNFHSCYDIKSLSNTSYFRRVCYPRVIITGQRKAGTSALFGLLQMHPNSVFASEKENCFLTRSNITLLQYFETLEHSIEPSKIYIDGCPEPYQNMVMRKEIFKNPKTLYIFLTRD